MTDIPATLRLYEPPDDQENSMQNCSNCGAEIQPERLEALPDTSTCINCSTVEKPTGLMVSGMAKGCGAELMIVPDDPEAKRQADRFNRRHR